MYLNIIFLLIGLVLSISSKVIQFTVKSKIGDGLVIIAAIFFVLAILHTIPAYKELLHNEQSMKNATLIAVLSCLAVISFQLTTMVTFGYQQKLGLLFLIPFFICTIILVLKIIF